MEQSRGCSTFFHALKMNAGADNQELRRLAWWRWSAFALGCSAFFLSFFHRVSTGAIAADLQHEFAIGAAALGTLGATYFYIYGLAQVPVGVLVDTLGPRIILAAGMSIAGIGSVAYGLAGNFATAAVARTLIGLGVSGVFVCTLKLHVNWFAEHRFATAAGVSNVSGILGALVATAPLAWLITLVSWRQVFAAIGIVSLGLAAAIWWFVRDAPEPDSRRVPAGNWRRALAEVAANPATWPPFWLTFSMSGAFMTLVSLWAVPFLVHVHGMEAVEAGSYTATMLVAFACCVPVLGWWSDRLKMRRPIAIAFAMAFSASVLLLFALPVPSGGGLVVAAALIGLAAPGFTLAWSIAKEVNPPERAGMAIAVANIGGFLASGILQPLVGWVVDDGAGVVAGGSANAYRLGIAVLVAWSLIGAVAATRLVETHCRNIWAELDAAGR